MAVAVVIALHEGGQRVEKDLWPVERVDVHFRLVVGAEPVGIKHDGRNVAAMSFSADAAAVRDRNVVGDHDGADMAMAEHLKCGIHRGYGDDSVSRMRQNSVTDRGQYPFG